MPVDVCALAIILGVIIGVVALCVVTTCKGSRADHSYVPAAQGTPGKPAAHPDPRAVHLAEQVPQDGGEHSFKPAQRPTTQEERKINGSLRPLPCNTMETPSLPMPTTSARPLTATLQQCTTTVGQTC